MSVRICLFLTATVSGCAPALAGAGTDPAVSGTLQIDGAAFTPTACHSGARYGLQGVELRDAAGKRLRASISHRPDASYPSPAVQGLAAVTVLEPGAPQGEQIEPIGPIEPCGLLTVGTQASKIVYRSVRGDAELSCTTDRHTITGHVEFSGCH
jgi:hypothetical protein